jgi:hypothetical protein
MVLHTSSTEASEALSAPEIHKFISLTNLVHLSFLLLIIVKYILHQQCENIIRHHPAHFQCLEMTITKHKQFIAIVITEETMDDGQNDRWHLEQDEFIKK